jgi:tRNA (uracil-5-)-methyltransferase TRM9
MRQRHRTCADFISQADLLDPTWPAAAAPLAPWRGALAFAVFHHLPGAENRLRVLRDLHALLQPGGWLVHSQWQFQHSAKLMARVLPWSAAGLNPADLEPGDTLLDWRFALPGQPEQTGLRYVHLFSLDELNHLAAQSGFQVQETFESDGQGGRLGLYQIWEKIWKMPEGWRCDRRSHLLDFMLPTQTRVRTRSGFGPFRC